MNTCPKIIKIMMAYVVISRTPISNHFISRKRIKSGILNLVIRADFERLEPILGEDGIKDINFIYSVEIGFSGYNCFYIFCRFELMKVHS